jgi:Helicase associated domain
MQASYEQEWKDGFLALKKFKKREGHLEVPRYHIEGTHRLGQWVAVQRYRKDAIPADRKAQLDRMGFIWSQRDEWWEHGYQALQKFERREGHCLVPALHIEGDLKLGYWVTVQRRYKNKMSRERKRRLNEIGFVWVAGPRSRGS